MITTVREAWHAGKVAREKRLAPVSPFYQVSIVRDGRRVDITCELERAWLAGYSGEPEPK